MRANEFINEGWYDDAKAKVNSATNAVKTSKVGQAVGSAAKAVGSAVKSDASAITQGGVNAVKGIGRAFGLGGAGARAHMSTQIFTKKFKETLKATQARQTQLGEPFNLATFSNAYMTKYRWKPGQLQTQLNAAITSNNVNQLAIVMDKIGSLNSVDPEAKGNEIDMTQPPAAPAHNPFRGV